jgi:hypothetical protein
MDTNGLPPKKLFALPFLISCFLGGLAGAIAIWAGFSPGPITILTGPACLLIAALIAALIIRTRNEAGSADVSFLFFLRNGLVVLTMAELVVSISCEHSFKARGFNFHFFKFWLLNCTWCLLLYIFLREQKSQKPREPKEPKGQA